MITRLEDIPKPTIINPPKMFTKPSTLEGVRKDNEWMKQHYQEYLGQWIALHEGELLGNGAIFHRLAGPSVGTSRIRRRYE